EAYYAPLGVRRMGAKSSCSGSLEERLPKPTEVLRWPWPAHSSGQRDDPAAKVQGQEMAAEEVQAEKAIDPGVGRKGVGEDGKTDPVLTQRRQSRQDDPRDDGRPASHRDRNAICRCVGVITQSGQDRR